LTNFKATFEISRLYGDTLRQKGYTSTKDNGKYCHIIPNLATNFKILFDCSRLQRSDNELKEMKSDA
jgi:hypothetical protein